ncbi:Ig-like domain-containing protein, partial [Aeromonas dhakensis]|uniref:Ig-like domain-containing protein n=1 Tax=Aeromonas dhakensis TaxID=196024 RepID=UPI0039B74C65
TASKDGITSNTVAVHVTDATITAIQVTPANVTVAKGQEQQLTAMAFYSDSTAVDVSHDVAWLPADSSSATVTPEGVLTGV